MAGRRQPVAVAGAHTRRRAPAQRPTLRRAALLLVTAALVTFAAACGRATETEINAALGITPTPTPSAEEIAAATERAQAAASAQAAAAASPGTAGQVAAVGDPVRGRSRFGTYCLQCHGPGGTAPNLLEPGGPGAALTYDELLVLIREGANHPPGPYPTFTLPDRTVADILAYILQEAGG